MGISLLHQYCIQLMYLQPLKITVSFHQQTPLPILYTYVRIMHAILVGHHTTLFAPSHRAIQTMVSLSHWLIHFLPGHRPCVWRLPVGTMSNQQLWFYLAIGFLYRDDQLVQSGPEHCLPGGRGPHERQTGSSWTTACGEGGRGGRGGRWRE